MVAVPAATPVTMPVDDPTVAMEVLPLVQVPPLTVLLKVDVVPGHSEVVPLIVPALVEELTVTVLVAMPVPQVFETV